MVAITMSQPPVTVGGLPLTLAVQDAIRRARAANGARAAAATAAAVPAPAGLPAPDFPRLAATLRGFTLAELRVDALRMAGEAADMREHIEGLACGRSYGDPALRGLTPAEFAARFLPEAAARAERAGAIADLLFRLIGRETALEAALTEGAGV